MENEVKDILFNKLKDRIDVCEINNGEEDKYHKYFLVIKRPSYSLYEMDKKFEISKDEFNKIKYYLEKRGCK